MAATLETHHALAMDAVAVERVAVALGGAEHPLAVLSLVDRRPRKPARKQFVLVRGIERVLYGVQEACRSTGAFANHLAKCTMGDAVLVCDKQGVADELLTEAELAAGASHVATCCNPDAEPSPRLLPLLRCAP